MAVGLDRDRTAIKPPAIYPTKWTGDQVVSTSVIAPASRRSGAIFLITCCDVSVLRVLYLYTYMLCATDFGE